MVQLYNPVLPITSEKIQDGAVILNKLAVNSVIWSNIVNGSIITDKLAVDSVSTNRIIDGSVTPPKLSIQPVGVGTKTQAIYITPGGFTNQDELNKPMNFDYRQCYPQNAADDPLISTNLRLPIGAVLDEVVFYLDMGNAASSVRCQVVRLHTWGARPPTIDALHNELITGVTGAQDSTYTGDHTLAGDDSLVLVLTLTGDTLGANAIFNGAKVTFVY